MKREFVVVEDEDEYGEIILSLAAIEVGYLPRAMRECAGRPPLRRSLLRCCC
jgi:hypothetical protein